MRPIWILFATMTLLLACGSEPQTFEEYKSAGKREFGDQDYAKAREYLGQAVRMKPSDRETLYFLGMAYSRDNLNDSAFHYLKRVDLLYPDDPETNRELYRLGVQLGEFNAAEKAVQALIRSGEPREQYLEDLAHLNIQQESFREAVRYFRELLEREPENPNRYLETANALASADSLEAAIDLIDSAVTLFGEREELLMNKGLYLSARKKYDQAEALFRRLAASDTSARHYRLNLANVLAEQDNKAKKREAYELYSQLQGKMGAGDYKIDSLKAELEKELNIKP